MYKLLYLFISICFIWSNISCNSAPKSITIPTDIQTVPEEIGWHLSQLLIQRGDIKDTPFTFTLDELLGENTLADFEDSPGMLILRMLTNEQVFLQKSWDNLLFQADHFGIKAKAAPVRTYFMQTASDVFSLICILNLSDKYYCFTATIRMKDEMNWYVSEVSKDIKKYNNLNQLEKEWVNMDKINSYFFEKQFSDEDIESLLKIKPYSHNPSPVLPELKHPAIPSLEPIVVDLSQGLTTKNVNLPVFSDNPTIKNEWSEVVTSLKEKQIYSIDCDPRLTNIPLNNPGTYNARINYSIICEEENDMYEFSCDVFLDKDEWKIISISPVYTPEKIEFFNF